jgi:hypothetical protein
MYGRITKTEAKTFKELLRIGENPEIEEVKKAIMFEFDISEVQMNRFMQKIERETANAHNKMEEMRKKYNELYFDSSNIGDKPTLQKSTPEESKKIDETVDNIEKNIKKLKNKSQEEKIRIIEKIAGYVEEISNCNFDVKQSSKLNELLQSNNLNIRVNNSHPINIKLEMIKSFSRIKLENVLESMENEIKQAKNFEEVSSIESQIVNNKALFEKCYGKYNRFQTALLNKKLELRNKDTNISDKLKVLIQGIANGSLDIEEANKIVDEEVKESASKTQKSFVKSSDEIKRRQITHKIRNALEGKSDEFRIQNPNASFEILQQLMPNEMQLNLRTVVKSLSSTERFSEAKEFCNSRLSAENNESGFFYNMRNELKKEIGRDEIASLVLRSLKASSTPVDEEKFLRSLEEGLNKLSLKPGSINICESQSGKKITLADIFQCELQKSI